MEKMQNTNTLVELLKKNGFKESESPLKDIYCALPSLKDSKKAQKTE